MRYMIQSLIGGCLVWAGLVVAQESDPTPGSPKFPEQIFSPLRLQVGYSGAVFRQNFTYGIGAKAVERTKCERGLETDPWNCRTATEGTSYYVTGLDSREGGDEVFVAGLMDDGTCVVERWVYPSREHGRRVTVPVPIELLLGTPLSSTTPVQTITGGGSCKGSTALKDGGFEGSRMTVSVLPYTETPSENPSPWRYPSHEAPLLPLEDPLRVPDRRGWSAAPDRFSRGPGA